MLYLNILSFKGYGEFVEFVNLVNEVKLAVEDFNDRITLRNNSILLGRGLVTSQNPLAYHYYQWAVRPKLLNLQKYLKSNYDELIQQ
ncbi:MAG: hypothetical protein GTO24_07370 [candidate division Zixibacteria bacterium]|nr:hypothetical protein [candidate division Zixibacteria bacterium]